MKKSLSGFTIVELLVVIVVIGILAAITIVSYSGISQKAIIATLQSDLDNASKTLKMYYAVHSSYPTGLNEYNCPTSPVADNNYCLKLSGTNTIYYNGSANNFSLLETNGTTYYKVTNDSEPSTTSSLDSGLVAYYNFNNDYGTTIVDSSGKGYNGTIPSSASHIINNMGQAINFDATNEYATIPVAHSFKNNLEGSYAFWFKSSCVYTGNAAIFNPGTSRVDTNFETGTRKIFVFNYDETPVSRLVWKSSDARYMDNLWHHIVVNKTSTRIDVYMDGVSVGGLNMSLKTYTDYAIGNIGSASFNTSSFDDVRIYNRSLNTNEIQNLYLQATP